MLSRSHPLPKLAVCLVWIAAACIVFDPWFLTGIIAVCAAVLILGEGIRPWIVLLAMIPFALFGLGFFTNAVLFRADDGFIAALADESPFRAEAAEAGLTLFLRAIACGMVSLVFAWTTDPGALTRALMAVRALPVRFGYALFAVLNLAPSLAAEIRMARIARAMRRGRPPRRVLWPGEAAALAIPLLAGAIRQAGRTAMAMEARGLGRTAQPTLLNVPVPARTDLLLATAGLIALAAVFAAARLM